MSINISNYAFQLSNPVFSELFASPYDLIILQQENALFTQTQINSLIAQGRELIAYVNISVTDDNQPYWDNSWTDDGTDTGIPVNGVAPSWLVGQPSNIYGIIADISNPAWQTIVIDRAVQLVNEGYSGIYLDDIGRYYDLFVAAGGGGINEIAPFANALMDLVVQIKTAIEAVNPNAYLTVNGDPYIVTNTVGGIASANSQAFLSSIDAMLLDNLFDVSNAGNVYQSGTIPAAINAAVTNISSSAQLLAIEHSGSPAEFNAFVETAWGQNIIPYTSVLDGYNVLANFDDLSPATAGNDNLIGGNGPNQLNAGAGNDIVVAGAGADTLNGGTGFDWLYGGDGDDIIYAGDGATDVSLGDGGNDTIYGEGGFDYIYGYADNDLLYGGADTDVIYGGTGNDNLYGEADTDWLFGGAGEDNLYGGANPDLLFGDAGADRIDAGIGNDWIWGGASDGLGDGAADIFVFDDSSGVDVIYDFENGIDKIDLSASGATSFADVSVGQIAGGFTWIAYGANVLYIWGAGGVSVGAGNIDASDFIF